MSAKILLTSFQTWLPHQKSNSSDDLLTLLQEQHGNFSNLSFLRQLPVDIHLATEQVVSNLKTLRPGGIICCGMA
ncbi:MAG: peptidase C15, partial [Cyanobacteria bacterium P01_A01_bin.40]